MMRRDLVCQLRGAANGAALEFTSLHNTAHEVVSQSRRLDQAEAAIREAIALVLDVEHDAFDVDITPELDRVEVSDETLEVLELRRELSELGDRPAVRPRLRSPRFGALG